MALSSSRVDCSSWKSEGGEEVGSARWLRVVSVALTVPDRREE
jgi:hypothetical protein